MKKSELLKMVREILAEMEDEELEEISTTGNVSGYNTPNAFKKTDGTDEDAEPDAAYIRRITTGTGYTQVNEGMTIGHAEVRRVERGLTSQKHKDELARLIKNGEIKTSSDLKNWRSSLTEGTNRYHQLRKEEGTPNQKIGKGIRELRRQLSEMEKFVTWYGKIKNESGLDSVNYWKRTQRHLSKISERLNKLTSKVRDLSV